LTRRLSTRSQATEPDEARRLLKAAALWGVAALTPLGLLLLLLVAPDADRRWENQSAHFWLVLTAALLALGLGYAVSMAARRRRDARLFLISLAFMASAGFLGLHALATPTVLLGKNAGFELATPVGLVVAGVLAAASTFELRPSRAAAVMRRAGLLTGALAALLLVWGVVSVAEWPPLDEPLAIEQLDGWQLGLAVAGVALFSLAALGYFRLYRRRRAGFVFAVTLAFLLLAEAMIVIAWARNWQLSWWEWHVLMLVSFGVIALAARSEWHEERFSALYLDETLAGAKDVSILFADLAGFTPFAERSSPEDVARMLNAYFNSVIPLMEELGGEVHQVVGDEVMVIFNKAGDRPDHAALAVRAAAALQDAAEEVAREHPDWPRFRVGVNSGEVLAGVVGGRRGHRKHGVVGDTVNLAARLQSEAPVGKVVLGAETVRRLPPGAVVERLPELRVKGKAEPVEAYVLRSLDARSASRGG
jgi:adenylate cyclase